MQSLFKIISKSEWLEKVSFDLKREAKDFNHIYNSELSKSPFTHAEDLSNYTVENNYDTPGHWLLIHNHKVDEINEFNTTALTVLKQGANCLRIESENTLSKDDFKNLFDQVILEYVQVHLKVNEASILNFLSYNDFIGTNVVNLNFSVPLDTIHLFDNNIKDRLPNAYFLTTSNQNISGWFLNMYHFLTHPDQEDKQLRYIIQRLELHIRLNTDFIYEIALLRAIRYLWKHFLSCFGLEEKALRILCYYEDRENQDEFEKLLINAGIALTAAKIGGANGFYVRQNSSKALSAEQHKMLINLNHLADLEGKLDFVNDPLGGSYHIEQLSNQIAGNHWIKFTESIDYNE